MPVIGRWRGGYEIAIDDGRAHRLTVDLPAEDGGHSAGASSSELAVAALAGSLATSFLLHARHEGLEVDGLTVVLEDDAASPSALPRRVRGTVRVRTRGATTVVEEILTLARRASPVARLFESAGVVLDLHPVTESPAIPARR